MRDMEKVKKWLELTGKSPAELSRLCGASENAAANWIAGKSTPRGIFVRRLNRITGIPLDDLIPREENDAA